MRIRNLRLSSYALVAIIVHQIIILSIFGPHEPLLAVILFHASIILSCLLLLRAILWLAVNTDHPVYEQGGIMFPLSAFIFVITFPGLLAYVNDIKQGTTSFPPESDKVLQWYTLIVAGVYGIGLAASSVVVLIGGFFFLLGYCCYITWWYGYQCLRTCFTMEKEGITEGFMALSREEEV